MSASHARTIFLRVLVLGSHRLGGWLCPPAGGGGNGIIHPAGGDGGAEGGGGDVDLAPEQDRRRGEREAARRGRPRRGGIADAAPSCAAARSVEAGRSARSLDERHAAGAPDGPLFGLAVGIKDIIDGVYDQEEVARELMVAEEHARFEAMSEKDLAKEIKKLEKEMVEHAKNLEFEKAAEARDRLFKLRSGAFGA